MPLGATVDLGSDPSKVSTSPNDLLPDRAETNSVRATYDDSSDMRGSIWVLRSLTSLADIAFKRFLGDRSTTDLHNAICVLAAAIRFCAKKDLQGSAALRRQGATLLITLQSYVVMQASVERELTGINDLISLCSNTMPDEDSPKSTYMFVLMSSFKVRFEHLSTPIDLDNSILFGEMGAELVHDGDSETAELLSTLSVLLKTRFSVYGQLRDQDMAIIHKEKAITLLPPDHPTLPRLYYSTSTTFMRRFERLRHLSDLERTVYYSELARNHPAVDSFLEYHTTNTIALASSYQFDETEDILYLDKAISMQQEAVNRYGEGSVDILVNLASSFTRRYHHCARISDLDEGINLTRHLLETYSLSNVQENFALHTLGILLRERFTRFGDEKDLEEAISTHKVGLAKAPDLDPQKPMYHHDLAQAVLSRYQSSLSNGSKFSREVEDLDEAIANLKAALALAPDDSPNRITYLVSLADSFHFRYNFLHERTDLDAAISVTDSALPIAQRGGTYLLAVNLSKARLLATRFDNLHNVADIDQAISLFQDLVAIIAESSPILPHVLFQLATAFHKRSKFLERSDDLGNALETISKAAKLSTCASPAVRYFIGETWILWELESASQQQSQRSRDNLVDAYENLHNMYPQIAWMGLNLKLRYQLLNSTAASRDGAQILMDILGHPKAVDWLEQGRSVVWGQILQLRSPIDELESSFPNIAREFQEISAKLEVESDLMDSGEVPHSEKSMSDLHQLAEKWDSVVRRVRILPGFERFMMPKRFGDIVNDLSCDGPIVILLTSKHGSTAIIISDKPDLGSMRGYVQLKLKDLTEEKLLSMYSLLKKTVVTAGRRQLRSDRLGRMVPSRTIDPDHLFRELLADLWFTTVEPVLKAFEDVKTLVKPAVPGNLRRIWWCPTGLLSFLPIHAAGIYPTDISKPSVSILDHFVSSYTPTLAALHAAAKPRHNVDTSPILMAVCQSDNSYAPPLPGAEEEIQILKHHLQKSSSKVLEVSGDKAIVSTVLRKMSECSFVHYACHGIQDPGEPTQSGLLLADRRLRLSEIIRQRLPNAEFAFLSACQTAMGDELKPDESMHLAAGMILAGYRSVIGTMWSIDDRDAPRTADIVYSQLVQGDGHLDSCQAALGLHTAVQDLRRCYNDSSFLNWVPFIHLGA